MSDGILGYPWLAVLLSLTAAGASTLVFHGRPGQTPVGRALASGVFLLGTFAGLGVATVARDGDALAYLRVGAAGWCGAWAAWLLVRLWTGNAQLLAVLHPGPVGAVLVVATVVALGWLSWGLTPTFRAIFLIFALPASAGAALRVTLLTRWARLPRARQAALERLLEGDDAPERGGPEVGPRGSS